MAGKFASSYFSKPEGGVQRGAGSPCAGHHEKSGGLHDFVRFLKRPESVAESLETVSYFAVADGFTKRKCVEAGFEAGKIVVLRGNHDSGARQQLRGALNGNPCPPKLWEAGDGNPSHARQVIVKYRQAIGQTLDRSKVR